MLNIPLRRQSSRAPPLVPVVDEDEEEHQRAIRATANASTRTAATPLPSTSTASAAEKQSTAVQSLMPTAMDASPRAALATDLANPSTSSSTLYTFSDLK